MLKAFNQSHTLVLSLHCNEWDGPFFCPACGEELVFKSGVMRIPHFAHFAHSPCQYRGESESHLYAKVQIWDGLRRDSDCAEVEFERTIGDRRPDIWAVIRGYPIAIEVQNSETTIADLAQKLSDYQRMGLYCIYVLPHSIPSGTYSAPAWQRYLHAMAYGNLYYFFQKHEIVTIHLGKYKYTQGRSRTEAFYLQRRPIDTYARRMTLTKFVPVFHSYEDLDCLHVGIVDALMWNFPKRNWWEQRTRLPFIDKGYQFEA